MKRCACMACIGIAVGYILLYAQGVWTVYGEDLEEAGAGGEEFGGQLYAKSAVLMDADSGRVLYAKEGDVPRPMASTTKIMTCIVALEQMKENDETAQVSENAARQPKVHLGIKEGETYYLRDLLYSLMLESHNDSAVVIAEHVGESIQGFASLMNKKASELGLCHTYFITPNGLDASDENGAHSTTAKELALIMKYCIRDSEKSQEFLEITGTKSYSFQDLSGTRSFTCNNHNAFLAMMEGALSGKTGFTGDAGYCYVGALRQDNRTFIVALLACGWPNNKSYKWADTKALMEYGLEHYQYRNIWKDVEPEAVTVENGIPNEGALSGASLVKVGIKEPLEEWQYLLREDEEIQVSVNQKDKLSAPVKKGAEAGEICYSLNGEVLGIWKLVTEEEKEKRDYRWCLRQLADRYVLAY